MSLTYDLKVGDGLAARVESDGSIGVYGKQLAILNGNVSTIAIRRTITGKSPATCHQDKIDVQYSGPPSSRNIKRNHQ